LHLDTYIHFLKVLSSKSSPIYIQFGSVFPLTANIFESGPMPTPFKNFGQLASHPKLLFGSKLSLG
jgi:hypothetical protein